MHIIYGDSVSITHPTQIHIILLHIWESILGSIIRWSRLMIFLIIDHLYTITTYIISHNDVHVLPVLFKTIFLAWFQTNHWLHFQNSCLKPTSPWVMNGRQLQPKVLIGGKSWPCLIPWINLLVFICLAAANDVTSNEKIQGSCAGSAALSEMMIDYHFLLKPQIAPVAPPFLEFTYWDYPSLLFPRELHLSSPPH